MGAIFPNETKVYIAAADIAGSALASSDAVTTEVGNFSVSGGGKDVESKPFFGGAFISVEKPREVYELSMDVVCTYANATRWEGLMMGQGITSTSCESSTEPTLKRIFIEATDGTSYKTLAMNNCRAVTFEPEMSSDEYMKGTITFKFTPTTSAAASNLKIANVIASNAYFV